MGWAVHYIAKLREGQQVQFRPRGNSMTGKIASGQLCTVAPVADGDIKIGDVVLCKVRGRDYLHLVKAIRGSQYQIGNMRGFINGWVGADAIFGRLICVED